LSKSRLMARFQSHQGARFHKNEDIIGDLEVPGDVLDLLFFGRDNQAQIRPCGSGADFAFSVAAVIWVESGPAGSKRSKESSSGLAGPTSRGKTGSSGSRQAFAD